MNELGLRHIRFVDDGAIRTIYANTGDFDVKMLIEDSALRMVIVAPASGQRGQTIFWTDGECVGDGSHRQGQIRTDYVRAAHQYADRILSFVDGLTYYYKQ